MSFNIVPAKNFKQARLETTKAEHLKAPQPGMIESVSKFLLNETISNGA